MSTALLSVTGALCLALPTAVPAAAGTAAPGTTAGHTVVSDGHIDIGPRFTESGWTVQMRDDTADPAVWRDTDDVVLQVRDAARIEVPEAEEFGFLGAPGDDVWVLPQAQQKGVVWPGWNSQDPTVTAAVEREVTWELTGVTGPGDFVLFLNGAFGSPQIVFDTAERLPQETGIEINSHVHGNWAFTEPGTYLLDVRMSARTKDGRTHDSRRTLRFSVGPQNPEKAFAQQPNSPVGSGTSADTPWWTITGVAAAAIAATVLILVVLRRRRRGDREDGTATAQAGVPGTAEGGTDESA
ncbi:TIGR03773 family transporter-associated surface protein [Streptomyces sp. NPDC059785]|uniref:TIGR03773 family transporter-associated surface protein n=1 Tax=Streptomyces sp. NPDC059785 TaxID=3346945 RepID=UPI00365EF551